MHSLYTENSEKWKSLASIDYFTQFVKAWIPFNAWYKNYYPSCGTDKKALEEIKAHRNKFRNKLISLLANSGIDGSAFRLHIAELNIRLENHHIFNRGERISFNSISIEINPQLEHSFIRNRCTYKAQRGMSNRRREIDIHIHKSNGSVSFSHTQTDGFNLQDLNENADFIRLKQPQQKNLLACYQEINPSKPISLLASNATNCIKMGDVSFTHDEDAIAKGLIEILYKLRNVLFHGEVIPDSNANKVYEPAYHILYTLIQAL